MRIVWLSFFVLVASGCSHGLYDWGGYNRSLYDYYESPESAALFRETLERHVSRMESVGKKPAPGLYAEIGTLYLQQGDSAKAVSFYEKEHQAWPESQHLMAALISNLRKDLNKE